MEKSKNIEHINIIVSQTNYTEEKAKKKGTRREEGERER